MSNQPNTPPPCPPRQSSGEPQQQPRQPWQDQNCQPPYGYGPQQSYGQQQPYGPQQPYGYGSQQPYGYGPQPASQPWQPYGQQQRRSNSMGIVGFIFALVSIFCGWIPIAGWIVWLVGAVFSFIGLFSRPRGLAIAGVIISLVLIPLIVTVLIALNSVSDILFYDTF